ncbi:MAG: hypothetical protein MPJ50_19675 [Pirellulales bacterium]|nr:hypothetical protein [Pirellulales bacterium]
MALVNHARKEIVTETMVDADVVRELIENPASLPEALNEELDADESSCLALESDETERQKHCVAAIYLRSAAGCKGAHAFELEETIRSNSSALPITCPDYIRLAIEWVTPAPIVPAPGTTT